MKKYYLLGVLAMGLMASCQEEDIFVKSQMNYSNVVVTASLDESSATRTQLSSEGKVFWSEGDALSIFSSNSAHAKFVLSKGNGTANADFKFESGDLSFGTEYGSNDFGYVGVYPYSESTTISKDASSYVINTVIPTEQAYAVNSFGQGASPMVAVDPSLKLSFKNVGSMLVMPLKGQATIVSATLKSASHNIAGAAKVTIAEESNWIPSVDVTEGASEIVLSCGEGVELSNETATKFYFVLASGTYEANDLVVRFYTNDGKYFETAISEMNTFERSKSLTFTERTFSESGIASFVTTEAALKAAIAEGKTPITLGADIILSDYIEIRDKEITINLNGKKLLHPSSSNATYKDVFEVYGNGKLTIQGEGQVIAEDGYAIYATGDSEVTLNGGYYFSPVSAVDARKNAKVTINGGEFKADGTNNSDGDYGQKFTLNLRDKTGSYASELSNFIVKGGKFYKFNPAASESEPTITNFVAPGFSSVADGDYYIVKEGVFNETALNAAIVNGAEIILSADLTLEKAITIPAGIIATINLNGFDVIAPNTDAFEVAGTLTINGTDESVVSAGSAKPNASVCAVWANGGTVIIYGGHYMVYSDANDKRNDCIYAGYNADNNNTAGKVTINGGKFEYVWPTTKNSGIDYNGDMFLLNCADKDLYQTLITVNGGQFKNNAPSYEPTTPNARQGSEVQLGVNKKVYNGTAEVKAAHNGTTDIWYEVK